MSRPRQNTADAGMARHSRRMSYGMASGEAPKLGFLQSSDIGHGVYRRLGFRDVEEYVLLTRPAPARAHLSVISRLGCDWRASVQSPAAVGSASSPSCESSVAES